MTSSDEKELKKVEIAVMKEDTFAKIQKSFAKQGSKACFNFLVDKFRTEKKYPELFEAILMQKRHELGLPLFPRGPLSDLPIDKQKSYDAGSIEAAREVGGYFLAEGDITKAWPYYRAIGEAGPVRDAIDRLSSSDDQEGVIEIAYNERVHPRKGFELLLENYGTCRAITHFAQYPGPEGLTESARLLTEKVYGELRDNLIRAIKRKEGEAPQSSSVSELISGRDWLFEGSNYYIDTSHVSSIVQYSLDWHESRNLRLVIELCEYGQKLSEMFQYAGQPPFENVFEDYEIYLRAVLGENVEIAIDHFRKKIETSDPYEVGTAPAQTLVKIFVQLGRFNEAIDVYQRYLKDSDPNYLNCPNARQLCDMAGDYERLCDLAREDDDLLSFTAAIVQK